MSDPLHTDDSRPPAELADADRDQKVEALLLAGLDHYFAGQYEPAINVWTRVLFLDRTHARARAYIERARGALAERHRELEELLHTGLAALNRGEADTARDLLMSAVERGGPHDEALALLQRLDRLEAATARAEAASGSETPSRRRPRRRVAGTEAKTRRRGWLRPVLLLGAFAAGAAVVALGWEDLDAFLMLQPPSRGAPALQARDEPLPVPTPSDVAMARARFLFERGHLRDALRALDAVRPGSPAKTDADGLRAAIQRALLEGTDPRAEVAGAPRGPGAPTVR